MGPIFSFQQLDLKIPNFKLYRKASFRSDISCVWAHMRVSLDLAIYINAIGASRDNAILHEEYEHSGL